MKGREPQEGRLNCMEQVRRFVDMLWSKWRIPFKPTRLRAETYEYSLSVPWTQGGRAVLSVSELCRLTLTFTTVNNAVGLWTADTNSWCCCRLLNPLFFFFFFSFYVCGDNRFSLFCLNLITANLSVDCNCVSSVKMINFLLFFILLPSFFFACLFLFNNLTL
jgi:hypothetical protein